MMSRQVDRERFHAAKRRVGAVFTLLAAASLLVSSCQVGQSGSEGQAGSGSSGDMDVDNTSPCPCGAPGTFLRVTLLALDGSDATVRVDALIHGGTSVRIGDTLRATWNGELPCSGRAEALSIGGSALAVYAPSSACDASDCTDDDASRATLQMTAWTDDVLMARTATARVTVPADELGRLWSDPLECRERFGDWSTLPGAFDGSTP